MYLRIIDKILMDLCLLESVFVAVQSIVPSIGELASSSTIGHDLHVVHMQIVIG